MGGKRTSGLGTSQHALMDVQGVPVVELDEVNRSNGEMLEVPSASLFRFVIPMTDAIWPGRISAGASDLTKTMSS